MSTKLPLLISRNHIVFPGCESRIDVGREKSIAAIELSLTKFDSQIILVSQKAQDIDNPLHRDIFDIGTLCTVKILKRNKKGEPLISVQSQKRVAIFEYDIEYTGIDEENSTAVWMTGYEVLKEKNLTLLKNKTLLNTLFMSLEMVLDINSPEFIEAKTLSKSFKLNISNVVNKLCHILPEEYDHGIKQNLLEELDVSKRIKLMMKHDFISDEYKEEINNNINRKVNRNISKQQKDFYLRERIRVMKEELGDVTTKEIDVQKVKQWLKKTLAPVAIKDKMNDELSKLECSSYMSNESSVIKNYMDWIMALPWSEYTETETDIEKIKNTLDQKHHSLEKVKERIIEFIATQKRTKNITGTIICLMGPPGVGKTSLAQSIAEALNKKYVKISLGGLGDESEIRGHRRTYVGSMPGKLIKALKTSKCNNPLILLDEIDKLHSNCHGDPISALLEVLDPKQNDKFADHYIEEDVDLSKVMFVATANYEDNIPEPLLDRMEIINLSSYTEQEKLNIAKHHLVDEVLKEHALDKKELLFTDESLLYIIQKYTKESGVRQFKQQLSKIARKFVKKQDLQKIKSEKIGIPELQKYLSTEIYTFTIKDEVAIPGVVNGMAYTEYGGDLLPIETNYYDGKGNILLTGNLKETMKESANVALSYIRANQKEFKIKGINWSDIDINLHVPSGGIPKDGPSAGITITTALISAFLKVPVPCHVAMTGEITLRGKVLPIGGLKEKIISATRGGIEVIFYPKECERMLEDIPKEILDKLQLHPIKHYMEIYDKLFK